MKAVIIIALVALASAEFIGSPESLNEINQSTDLWVAGENKFTGMSVGEVQRFHLGTINTPIDANEETHEGLLKVLTVPKSFDARKQWPNCITKIQYSKHCAAGWAFSAAEVLSDRFCIQTSNAVETVLSA